MVPTKGWYKTEGNYAQIIHHKLKADRPRDPWLSALVWKSLINEFDCENPARASSI